MVVRVEQLYPFPEKKLKKVLAIFNDPKIVWCQEEPRNMGVSLWSMSGSANC